MHTPQAKAKNLMLRSILGDARQLSTFPPASFLWSSVNTQKQRCAVSAQFCNRSLDAYHYRKTMTTVRAADASHSDVIEHIAAGDPDSPR